MRIWIFRVTSWIIKIPGDLPRRATSFSAHVPCRRVAGTLRAADARPGADGARALGGGAAGAQGDAVREPGRHGVLEVEDQVLLRNMDAVISKHSCQAAAAVKRRH